MPRNDKARRLAVARHKYGDDPDRLRRKVLAILDEDEDAGVRSAVVNEREAARRRRMAVDFSDSDGASGANSDSPTPSRGRSRKRKRASRSRSASRTRAGGAPRKRRRTRGTRVPKGKTFVKQRLAQRGLHAVLGVRSGRQIRRALRARRGGGGAEGVTVVSSLYMPVDNALLVSVLVPEGCVPDVSSSLMSITVTNRPNEFVLVLRATGECRIGYRPADRGAPDL